MQFIITAVTTRLDVYAALREHCPWFTPQTAWKLTREVMHEAYTHDTPMGFYHPDLHFPGGYCDPSQIIFTR